MRWPRIPHTPASLAALTAAALLGDGRAGARQDDGVSTPVLGAEGPVDVVVRRPVPGVHMVAPDVGVARLSRDRAMRLAREVPGLDLQILPPVRLASDVSGPVIGVPAVDTQDLAGRGVFLGFVDSGFDVTHPALRAPDGQTRILWLLDYTRRARGVHPELEAKYAIASCLLQDVAGAASDGGVCTPDPRCAAATPCAVTNGAIYAKAELDALLHDPAPAEPLPVDEEGHGTHAMSIAGGTRLPTTGFRGVAPEARLVGVKAAVLGDAVSAASVLQGLAFIYDRAAEAGAPAVVNLSLTSDFVVRDGSDGFGAAIAVLNRGAGRIVVAAAGNRGDPGSGAHQTATVADEARVRIPVRPLRTSGRLSIIVAPHPGADVQIGCDAPEGAWVTPIERGRTRSGKLAGDRVANVVFDPKDFAGRLPASSTSALVTMEGRLDPDGDYALVLEGSGTADMWISGGAFAQGVREQTIGSPAMHPEVIAAGATIARTGYRSASGEDFVFRSSVYDEAGGLRLHQDGRPTAGEVADFSGAGPGPTGAVKPDVLAPGILVAGAASPSRAPASSIFNPVFCPRRPDGETSSDPDCALIDAEHGIATGTSFAAPFVAGAAAILLEVDPTLRHAEVRAALQAGAHRHRVPSRFLEAASVGELDIPGSIDVVRRMRAPSGLVPPAAAASWIVPSSHYVPADGTRPLEVLLHLRGAGGEPADGFDVNRFRSTVESGAWLGQPRRLERLAPGLWSAAFDVPADRAGSAVTIRATFDGAPAAPPVTIPVAVDPWQARYPPSAHGPYCAHGREADAGPAWLVLGLALSAWALRRRARR